MDLEKFQQLPVSVHYLCYSWIFSIKIGRWMCHKLRICRSTLNLFLVYNVLQSYALSSFGFIHLKLRKFLTSPTFKLCYPAGAFMWLWYVYWPMILSCRYSLEDLHTDRVYLVNLKVNVCFSAAASQCNQEYTVFNRTRLPKALCQWDNDFVVPGMIIRVTMTLYRDMEIHPCVRDLQFTMGLACCTR